MRTLIYGQGWIGNQVISLLESDLDNTIIIGNRAENLKEVEGDIQKYAPTHVMAFIGRTHGKIGDKVYPTIDYLEQPGKILENVRDNIFAPIALAILCKKYHIHLTYLGTGCVFEYTDPDHPLGQEINGFTEESIPNFFGSSYSIVKGYTDQLMHLFGDTVLNVRIRMPITDEVCPRNFITKITKYNKICSIPNSMTVLDDLLPVMVDMAKNKLTGTINLVNPGLISHNEILEMYREIVDPAFIWQNFTIEEQAQILAAGRSNNYLDTHKLESMYSVMNIKNSVRACLMRMAIRQRVKYREI